MDDRDTDFILQRSKNVEYIYSTQTNECLLPNVCLLHSRVGVRKFLLNYKRLQKSLRVIQTHGIEEGAGTGVSGGRAGGRERG